MPASQSSQAPSQTPAAARPRRPSCALPCFSRAQPAPSLRSPSSAQLLPRCSLRPCPPPPSLLLPPLGGELFRFASGFPVHCSSDSSSCFSPLAPPHDWLEVSSWVSILLCLTLPPLAHSIHGHEHQPVDSDPLAPAGLSQPISWPLVLWVFRKLFTSTTGPCTLSPLPTTLSAGSSRGCILLVIELSFRLTCHPRRASLDLNQPPLFVKDSLLFFVALTAVLPPFFGDIHCLSWYLTFTGAEAP